MFKFGDMKIKSFFWFLTDQIQNLQKIKNNVTLINSFNI